MKADETLDYGKPSKTKKHFKSASTNMNSIRIGGRGKCVWREREKNEDKRVWTLVDRPDRRLLSNYQ